MLALVYLLAMMIVSVLVIALALWGCAWLFRAPRNSFLRALGAATIYQLGIYVTAAPLLLTDFFGLPALAWLLLGVWLIGPVMLVQAMFGLTIWKAIVTWYSQVVASSAMLLAIIIPLRMYVVEAFATSSNSMAPTLLGRHRVGDCPHCGGKLIVPYYAEEEEGPFGPLATLETHDGICRTCKQLATVNGVPRRVHIGDRLCVDKTLTPQRWDLVTYYAPPDAYQPDRPRPLFVHRLVGLPGETIELRDGEFYIDGAPAVCTPEMVGLKYEPGVNQVTEYALVEGEPVTLGEDEYFVIGDYSTSAMDSRYSGPVPGGDLHGVVSLVYWPPTSWRVLR